jgi:hypothetical protein
LRDEEITDIGPLRILPGVIACIELSERIVKFPEVPLNKTLLTLSKLVPYISVVLPELTFKGEKELIVIGL